MGRHRPHPPPRTVAHDVCAEFEERGATGRTMFWRRDLARILADLDLFAIEDHGHPTHAEWSFDSMPYRLPDGRSVYFRGSVDRVDEAADGSMTVIDYKTGSASSYAGLSAQDPHQAGTHLQLGVYGEAVRLSLGAPSVDAGYWFVTTKGKFARVGYEVTPVVRDAVGATLATIVDGIRAGMFPARPPADPSFLYVDCWYCSPDGLSSREARRDWERKRRDPALAYYVRMCEPEAIR